MLEIKRQYRNADTLSEAFYYLCFPKKADRNEIAVWATRKPELRASLEEAEQTGLASPNIPVA